MSTDPKKILKGRTVIQRHRSWRWRPVTDQELADWRASPDSHGMDDAGEPKLPPTHKSVRADGRTYKVTRARVEAPRGYGKVPGCAEIQDHDGILWWVKRTDIAVIG